jgi:hypothetical protein
MRLLQTKTTSALTSAPTKLIVDHAASDSFVTYLAPTKIFVPITPPVLGPTERQYNGDYNNAYLEDHTEYGSDDDTTRDVVFGNGGFDYISTGGGNDDITVGNNNSSWRGSGNEFTLGATTVDGGRGNDKIVVSATQGAFHLQTGEGSDYIFVRDADYVKIDAADVDTQQDTFVFAATFGGTAEIYGADAAWHDQLVFQGGGSWEGGAWRETSLSDGTLAFQNVTTGGTVIVHGSEYDNLATNPSWFIEPV